MGRPGQMPPKAVKAEEEEVKVDPKKVWEVTGGLEEGGIAAREEASRSAAQVSEQLLSPHALIKEIDAKPGWLRYELLTGVGPYSGWVPYRGQDKQPQFAKAHCHAYGEPLLVCWYSGGFTADEGKALLSNFLLGAAQHGIKDHLVLHFPNEYGMEAEGHKPWGRYVDQLIYEINKDKQNRERPLILFGHSRGAAPCLSVATRLGRRVRKVYVAACGAMKVGEPTGWELMSKEFKAGGDRALMQFFASMNPDNTLLNRTATAPDDEMKATIEGSKFLKEKVRLFATQYRDAMFPDMNWDVKVISSPLTCLQPLQDQTCPAELCEAWRGMTTGRFSLVPLDAGHMDCLDPKHLGPVYEDMLTFFPANLPITT